MSNKLVAYFSASGTTGGIAKKLADAAGAEHAIEPAVSTDGAGVEFVFEACCWLFKPKPNKLNPTVFIFISPI